MNNNETVKNFNVISWSCQGFFAKYTEFKCLLNEFSPYIINLQETKYRANFVPKLNKYNGYYKNVDSQTISHGGVCSFVHEDIHSIPINLNTDLQAVAFQISYPFEHVICNLYLPGSTIVDKQKLVHLINQLGQKFILVGHFNAHNPPWGSVKLDNRGKIIEEIID